MRVSRGGLFALGVVGVAAFLGVCLKIHMSNPLPTQPSETGMISHVNGNVILRSDSPALKRLTVQSVSALSGAEHLSLPAQVMAIPDHQVNVLAPVTGRIVEVRVQLGQHVSQGQVLATVAAGDLDQAWADDRRAKSALDFAQRAFNRAKGVQAAGGNAVKDLESARNDLTQAEAEAQRTQNRLQVMGARADYSRRGQVPLVSPIDGVVSAMTMAIGQNIMDTTAVQMTVMDLSSVWVAVAVPENVTALLNIRTRFEISFPSLPDYHCSGVLVSRDPALKPDTRRANAYVVCPNSDALLSPGLFATAIMELPSNHLLMLPKSALLMNNDQVSVFVEIGPNTYRRRIVNISYDEGDSVRVLSGISAGDRVVTSGAILLNDD